MPSSMIVCIFLQLFMVEIQSIFGDISQGMAAFDKYSECSAFQTPPVSQGVYRVRTKTGCARICSEDTACAAYSVSGSLCRTHDEAFQTGECYSGGWKHYNIRKRCTKDGNTDIDTLKCKCYGGYIGDDCERLMIDCSEGFASGHYEGKDGLFHIHPALSPESFQVWCRMAHGGSTFIQRHKHNSTNFYRTWQDYKDGFGDLRYDFWLGNDKISNLVNGRDYILVFNYRDVSTSSIRQQMYTEFKLNRSNGYQMSYAATWGSTKSSVDGGDCLGELRGQRFSTFDQDNDDSPLNCAEVHQSGFWFKNCTPCNPNGVWSETPDKKRAGVPEEMFWTSAHGDNLILSCWAFLKVN
ncbi:fibrinogen-like protein 1 [Haliotis cracherodii]|uniref:fibrinogen-like protein 1 n=1 Tax=Haliotis cracherodii TaxID=6455 RepID=UPI0039E8BCA6